MKRIVLVNCVEAEIGKELIGRLLDEGDRLFSPTGLSLQDNEWVKNENITFALWNRNSAISAKAMFHESLRFLGSIDVLVIFPPVVGGSDSIAELSTAAMEEKIDDSIKGGLFLIKEYFKHFEKTKKGSMMFVDDSFRLNSDVSVLQSASDSFFKGFYRALLQRKRTPFLLLEIGFSKYYPEGYSSFILDCLKKTKGNKASKTYYYGAFYAFTDMMRNKWKEWRRTK